MVHTTLTTEEQEEINRTVDFAVRLHQGQYRKGSGLPFIVHPMGVLTMVGTDWGLHDLTIWKVCVCHDIGEDCDVTFEEIAEVIGDDATDIVRELTFHVDPQDDRAPNIQKRDYMRSFMGKRVESVVVKCADRFCNVLDWLATDPDYAVKYWNKASDLMDAMFTRGEEIIAKYGDDVFVNMKYTRTLLTRQLQR